MKIEERICIKCGESKEIPQTKAHANNICKDCQLTKAREHARKKAIDDGKRIGVIGRKPYPGTFDIAARTKFYRLKTELGKCKHREEWIPIIKRNLNVALNDETLMLWIRTEKDDDKPAKKQKTIIKDYPDTRGMTWEEYQKGLGKDDVNS
jgi:hypothetical protein